MPGSERTIAIALGSNLGDRAATVRQAYAELSRSPLINRARLSPLYATAPVRVEDGPLDPGGEYINAVVVAQSAAAPAALLVLLHGIESKLGRDRAASPHGAPRPIDLDLLLVGDTVLATPALTLPHTRMHQRAFVLVPLAAVAPELVVPGPGGLGRTVADLVGSLGPLDAGTVRRIES